jgi:uncharacterized membrane protein
VHAISWRLRDALATRHRVADRCRSDGGFAVVAVATVLWVFLMGLNVWRRHDRFDTFDNDLGFHTQFVWLLSRGHWFSSILGLSPFAHNATFGYFLFVPFAWLRLNVAQVLDLTQTLAVALGVVPVFRLARRRLGEGWISAALPLLYLLHPVVQGNVWETFHPEAMAMTPLLCAYDAADEGRFGTYWRWIALAIIWKTDVALFIAVLGLVFVRRRDRRVGWRTFALGAVWFVAVVGIMIPSLSGGGTVFGPLYGDLGDTPAQVIKSSVAHPDRFARHLRDAHPVRYGRDLLAPYAFLPVLAPANLLIGLPQNMVSLLSDAEFTRDPIDNPHYQALPLVALTMALVEACGFVRRRWPTGVEPVVAITFAAALATSVAWGSLPFGVRASHFWSEDGDPLRAAKEHAIAMVDDSDVVSAQYRLVPHLAERRLVYSFPNPWRQVYYGVEGTAQPDPAVVEWLVFDLSVPFSESDQQLVDCILGSGTFDEQYREGEIVVYQRNAAEPIDADCR